MKKRNRPLSELITEKPKPYLGKTYRPKKTNGYHYPSLDNLKEKPSTEKIKAKNILLKKTKLEKKLTQSQIQMANWLKTFNFNVFGTHTTAKELTLKGARRMAERFHNNFPEVTMFWAAEPFETRKGYHFHTLINTFTKTEITEIEFYKRLDFKEYWQDLKKFGYAYFLPIKGIDNYNGKTFLEEYVTKYITKNTADYDIYTPQLPAPKKVYVKPLL